jgi:positive regulator of sigma E activity
MHNKSKQENQRDKVLNTATLIYIKYLVYMIILITKINPYNFDSDKITILPTIKLLAIWLLNKY